MKTKLKIIIPTIIILLALASIFIHNQINKNKTFNIPPQSIDDIIKIFRSGDKEEIVDCFSFPYMRKYPFEIIKDREDFLEHFDEVLDEKIIARIAKSKSEDWKKVGWHGITLIEKRDEGIATIVWIEYDFKICGINLETKNYKKLFDEFVEIDKGPLPENLQDYLEPVAKWNYDNTIYRIDKTAEDVYRFVILEDEIPTLILENGTLRLDGTGGAHYYTWENLTDKKRHIIYFDMDNNAQYSIIVHKDNIEDIDQIDNNVILEFK